MAQMNKISYLKKLEDFIEIARAGKHVEVEVELRRHSTNPMVNSQAVYTGEAQNMDDNINTYVMSADYSFKIDGQVYMLSKIYMFTTSEASAAQARDNWIIANARLNVDYKRLKAAHVAIQEKYF